MQTYHYEQVCPPPPLSDRIECFWRLLAPTMPPPSEIISAEGRAEILFQFEGRSQALPFDEDLVFECASSWLVRPFASAMCVRQVGVSASAMIGVRFSPAGWAAFCHNDTTDNQPYSLMPLSHFYAPGDVRVLEEQLYHALHTPQWAYPLVAFFLRRRIEQTHFDRVAYAARQLRQRQISVAALASNVNLSERQFGRVFRQLVGLSPKQYARIARLERILYSPTPDNNGLTLEQLALRYGYYDAPHLVREFRALVGVSPVDYFSGYYDLIEQKTREHDRFLQCDPDTMSISFNK
ncbi:MAG: AraC family transcriptional regulator [Chloroflexota bacterium]|nr:AraC family transcriptional regulator [Chloroflexota bacterium]